MITIDPLAPADINKRGEPVTLQRLIYMTARCNTADEWRAVNQLAHSLLEEVISAGHPDTELSLLLNATATLSHEVVRLRTGVEQLAR